MRSSLNLSMMLYLALGLMSLQGALAHTYLSSVVIDGVALAEGDCVRPHPLIYYDNPIPFLTEVNMTCGFVPFALEAANDKCAVTAGSTIGIQWHHISDASTDDILDSSHKGPVLFYLAKSDTGSGDVWFKIYEDGYTNSTGLWATDKLIANVGLVTITLPSDIAPGNYLLRGEVIALHQAYELNGVQPYVGCVELTISGSGAANPAGVAFPGAYTDTDPGILINIYVPFGPYIIPGPPLYVSSSSSGTASASASSSASASASSSHATTASASSSSSSSSGHAATTGTKSSSSSTTGSTPGSSSGSSTGSSSSTVTITIYSSASQWWFALTVSGVSASTIASIDVKDSGSYSTYSAMTSASWGYYKATTGLAFTTPLTVLITSVSGNTATATVAEITPNLVIDTNDEL